MNRPPSLNDVVLQDALSKSPGLDRFGSEGTLARYFRDTQNR